jgi:hypothetical protein
MIFPLRERLEGRNASGTSASGNIHTRLAVRVPVAASPLNTGKLIRLRHHLHVETVTRCLCHFGYGRANDADEEAAALHDLRRAFFGIAADRPKGDVDRATSSSNHALLKSRNASRF